MKHGDAYAYVRTQRMDEQRWLLDNVIRVVGVDWDQARTRYTVLPAGLDAEPDFARVRERVRKFADIEREFASGAERRQRLALEAEAAGRYVEAREHAFVAALLWGNAQWPLFGNSARNLELERSKGRCYDLYIKYAAHPVSRVEIPFRDATLPGYLHLPRGASERVPCVIQIGGMDSFKEHYVAMYGDKFLERGIARLAVEIPGQGEALARGLFVSEQSTPDAGQAIVAWMGTQAELDRQQIGLAGNSFGSFWATQIAAAVEGLVGCAVAGPIHEPGMHTIFETASPTFKARFMYMADQTDEAAFDEFARQLDLRKNASAVTCPYLVVAGEADELSPIQHTFDLVRRIAGPVEMVVYQGEKHSLGGGAASTLGPNRHHLVAQWFADRFEGRPASERLLYVDAAGRVEEQPAPWR